MSNPTLYIEEPNWNVLQAQTKNIGVYLTDCKIRPNTKQALSKKAKKEQIL